MSVKVVIPTERDKWNSANKRELLFFDELLIGYVLFSKQVDQDLDQAGIEISLVDHSHPDPVILKAIELTDLVHEEDTLAVYKFDVFTLFPKIKLKEPTLRLNVKGSLKVKKEVIEEDPNEKLLTSFHPANSANVLEGLNFSISTNSTKKIVLLDSLITDKEASTIDELASVELLDSLEIPIIRTMNIRIRNVKLKNSTLITTLDIEHSSKAKTHDLKIELTSIGFKNNPYFSPLFHNNFPLSIINNGTYTFSYQLTQENQLLVKNAQALIEIRYRINSTNAILTKLFTNVDLNKVNAVTTTKQPGSLTPVIANNNNPFTALTIKYIGNKIVRVGEPFKLKVFISNQSSNPRNLLMVFNSNTTQNIAEFQPNLPKIKSLIQSNSSLLETYSNLRIKTQGVLSLVNEIQFKLKSKGTIEGQNAFQNEIELIALEIGVFNLQGVKLIDLTTGETLNCDRLLEIVVES